MKKEDQEKKDQKQIDAMIRGEKKPQPKQGLGSQFMEALAYFGPVLAAGFLGESKEGASGFVESAGAASKLQKGFMDFKLKKRELASQGEGLTDYQRVAAHQRKKEYDLAQQRQNLAQQRNERLSSASGRDTVYRFIKLPKIQKAEEALTIAGASIEMLETGSPLAPTVSATGLARLSGEVGRLSDFDIKRFKDPQIKNSVINWIKTRFQGEPGEGVKDTYMEAIQLLKRRKQEEIRLSALGYARSMYPKDKEAQQQLYERLYAGFIFDSPETEAAKQRVTKQPVNRLEHEQNIPIGDKVKKAIDSGNISPRLIQMLKTNPAYADLLKYYENSKKIKGGR